MECLRNCILGDVDTVDGDVGHFEHVQISLKLCSVRLFRRYVKASWSLSSGWLLHTLIFHMLYAATGNGASAMLSWETALWTDGTKTVFTNHFQLKPLDTASLSRFFGLPDGWLQNSLGPHFWEMFSDRKHVSAVLVFEVNLLDPKWSLDCKPSVGTVLKIFRRAIAEVQNSRDGWCNRLIRLYIRSRPFEGNLWRIRGCRFFSRYQRWRSNWGQSAHPSAGPLCSHWPARVSVWIVCNDDTMGWAVNSKPSLDNWGTYQKSVTTHFFGCGTVVGGWRAVRDRCLPDHVIILV